MNKNNTNYQKDIYEKIKSNLINLPNSIKDNLFKHQQILYNFILLNDSRGILVIHQTGSGKTITAISITEELKKFNRDIIIISPKSLKFNFKKEIRNYNKKINKNITDDEVDNIINNYNFVTLGASNMIEQLNIEAKYDKLLKKITNTNLDNKVIVVDEAHLLFKSIVNGSLIANEFYNLIMNAKNIKILFLTATPIITHPFEMVPALNMCHGYIFDKILNKNITILPEDFNEFVNLYIDESRNIIKNKRKLQNRLYGLISYYNKLFFEKQDPFNIEIKKTIKKKDFPDKLPLKIINVEMDEFQNVAYDTARAVERLQTFKKIGGSITKNADRVSSSYRIKTRQLSNYYETPEGDKYCPKLHKIYDNINKFHNNQLNIIYSNFLKAGLIAMSDVLIENGYELYEMNKKSDKRKFAFFTGDESLSTNEERENIIKQFIDKKNKNGDIIHILLISSSGAQGLDLKNVRAVHIVEPYWNYSRIEQVEARAIRYNSHIDLEPKDRNVQVYIYLSDYNKKLLKEKKNKIKDLITKYKKINKKIPKQELEIEYPTDVHIFLSSIKKPVLNNQFIQAMAEVSIDCNFHNEKINFDCYNCVYSNKQLYDNDYIKDIDLYNPCDEEVIDVDEIIYDGNKYYYTEKNNKKIILKYNEFTDNYIELKDPILINKISKKL